MKYVELKLLCELLKNSRKSDRELAKRIGVSQPTITRTRSKLEKEGVIDYSGVPNLKKLDFEMMALTFANWRFERYPDTKASKAKNFISTHPNIIFVATGKGLSSDRVAVSVHKNYSDYAKYIQEVKAEWADYMAITGSFIISLTTDSILRPITFRYLADCLEKEIPEKTQQ
jgi:DNA-binding Lrp family transcriptional regulator